MPGARDPRQRRPGVRSRDREGAARGAARLQGAGRREGRPRTRRTSPTPSRSTRRCASSWRRTDDTARFRHLGRRQPLLRAARRVHPADRAALPRPRRARGRHPRRPAADLDRRPRVPLPRRHLRELREDGAARLAARVPEVARQRAAGRARVGRDPDGPRLREPRRAPRAHGRAGRRGGVPVPDARRVRRALPARRRRALLREPARVQPLARRDLGLRVEGTHLRVARDLAARPRRGAARPRGGARARRADHQRAHRARPAGTRPPTRSSTASGRSPTRRSSRSRTTSAKRATTS